MRVDPTPCLRELLAALYPTVRWEEVSFHEGIPPLLGLFTQGGITFPDPLGTRAIDVYVARWDPCGTAGLALLVHEAFHVLQFQEGGAGIGPIRGFSLRYLTRATWEGGGERNLYEKPAYAQERAFARACAALPRPLCDCATGAIDREMLDRLLRIDPSLVRRTAREG